MRFFSTLILTFGFLSAAMGFDNDKSLEQLKEEARLRLLARKKGFDKYQQRLAEFEKRRLAVAFKQKAIRKAHAAKKEKARKSFVRKSSPFPRQAYVDFLAKRKRRIKNLEKSRKTYSELQKEIEKVFENRKYRIDGKKEFNL